MKRNRWKSIAVTYGLTAAALVVPQVAQANWPNYTLYNIPGMDNLNVSPYAINSYNEVAGSANFSSNQNDFTAMTGGVGKASSFYNLPNNWDTFQLNSMNNAGAAVGTVWIGVHPTAMYYKTGSQPQNMQAGLTYTYQSIGNGVNHAGIAVGSYNREDPTGLHSHMFRWDPSTQTRTGDWLNLIPGGINENGMMVAQNTVPTNYYHLAELEFVPATGGTTIVTAPGFYTYMQPNGLSTSGGITVVGDMLSYIENASNSYASGFVYNQMGNYWQILGGVGNEYYETHGLGVDYWGDRVAGYTVDATGNQIATVWENDGGTWNPTDLQTLVPDPLWHYNQATAISPEGAISGFGMHKEGHRWFPRAFVLTPSNLIRLGPLEGGIRGGLTASMNLRLGGVDPFALDFGLSTVSRMVSVPGGLRLPGGQSSLTFPMQTQGVDVNTKVEVMASFGGLTTVQEYLLLPAVFTAFTLKPTDGGETGMVTFDGAAGPSGIKVSLSSSNPNVTVPSSLKVDQGGSTASFRIVVGKGVARGTVVTITAATKSTSLSQTFIVS